MPVEREGLGMVGMCLLIVVLSVLGVAAAFFTHLIGTVDGLLMLMVCLLMGGLFLLMLFLVAKDEGWLPVRHRKHSAAEAASANPASVNPGPAKPAEGNKAKVTVPPGPS